MLQLSGVIAQEARMRDECAGAYKPDFPAVDDKNFLEDDQGIFRTGCRRAEVRVEPVDTSLIPPSRGSMTR